MLALLRLLLLPVRLPFQLLRLLHGASVFITCVVPIVIAAVVMAGIAWWVFLR